MSLGPHPECDTAGMFPRRAAALLLAIGMAAAACSTGEEPASDDPALGDLLAPPDDENDPAATSEAATTTLLPPTPTDPPAIDGPMFADRAVACGGARTSVSLTMVGVDADTITIGSGNDRGGVFAGDAGRAMPDAVAAMAGLCNELGGLNGRTVVVRDYDAAVTEVEGRAQQQCGEVAALVGHGFLDAIAGVEIWTECGLPRFPGWAPDAFGPPTLIAHGFAALADPAALTAAVVGPDTAAGQAERVAVTDAMTAAGFSIVLDLSYPVTSEPDWAALAAELRRAEVGLVDVDGGCGGALVPLLGALTAAGAGPYVVADHRAYDPGCLSGVAADVPIDRLLLELPFLPLEDGGDAPSTAAYADALDRFAVEVTGDTLLAASAFWRFTEAAGRCPGLERSCLREAAARAWDGLDLHPVGEEAGCRVVVGVSEAGLERVTPTRPGTYGCPEAD